MTIKPPSLLGKRILLTRTKEDNKLFKVYLETYHAITYNFPCISIKKNTLTQSMQQQLKNFVTFDWLVFTSANGVKYFVDFFKRSSTGLAAIQNMKVAVVGPATSQAAKQHQFPITCMPAEYLTEQIAQAMGNVQKQTILLPRSNIAPLTLAQALERKGAIVTEVPIYKTEYLDESNDAFAAITAGNPLDYITFTSASTVAGFLHRVTDAQLRAKAFATRVLAIGPVTTKTAQDAGFSDIITAKQYTIDSMIQTLRNRSAS